MKYLHSNFNFKHHNDRIVLDQLQIHEPEKPGIKSYNKFIGLILGCLGLASRLKAKNKDGKETIYYVNSRSYQNWIDRENAHYRFSRTLTTIDEIVQAVSKQVKSQTSSESTSSNHIGPEIKQELQNAAVEKDIEEAQKQEEAKKKQEEVLSELIKCSKKEGEAYLIDFSKVNPSNIFKIFDKDGRTIAYGDAAISDRIIFDESSKFTQNFPFKYTLSVVVLEKNENGYPNSSSYMFTMNEEGKVESYGEIFDNFDAYLTYRIKSISYSNLCKFEHLDFSSIFTNREYKKLRKKSPETTIQQAVPPTISQPLLISPTLSNVPKSADTIEVGAGQRVPQDTKVMEGLKNLAQVLKQGFVASKGSQSFVTFIEILSKYQTLTFNLCNQTKDFIISSEKALKHLQTMGKLVEKERFDLVTKKMHTSGFLEQIIKGYVELIEECKNLRSMSNEAWKASPNDFKKHFNTSEETLEALKTLLDQDSLYLQELKSSEEKEQGLASQPEEISKNIQKSGKIWDDLSQKYKNLYEMLAEVNGAINSVMCNL